MNTLERGPVLRCGQVVRGRWEQNSYRVMRLLGQGGTGHVYLVKNREGQLRAMKISTDLEGITHEHRMLLSLNSCGQIKELGVVPQVYELDDFQTGSIVNHYIVTQYCPGTNVGRRGEFGIRDTAVLGKQVAQFLSSLHQTGRVFGDLKPSNVIYDFKRNMTHIIDYGSVTFKGHCLKQYTPGYDRASWLAGPRTADEHYDIFALGMLLSTLLLGKANKYQVGLAAVIARVTTKINHPQLRKTVVKALKQEYLQCHEIAAELSQVADEISVQDSGRAVGFFVNFMGAASVLAFILGLAYYYQQ